MDVHERKGKRTDKLTTKRPRRFQRVDVISYSFIRFQTFVSAIVQLTNVPLTTALPAPYIWRGGELQELPQETPIGQPARLNGSRQTTGTKESRKFVRLSPLQFLNTAV